MKISGGIKYSDRYLPIIFFMSVLFHLSTSAEITHTYKFDFQSLQLDSVKSPDGRVFLKLSGNNLYSDAEPGHPDIPTETVRFLVPDNASDFSVQLNKTGKSVLINLSAPLYPVQEPIPTNNSRVAEFTYPDTIAYSDYSSEIAAEIIDESWMEGQYHIVAVRVHPFAYKSSMNSLEICESLDINLFYTNNSSRSGLKAQTLKGNGFINIGDVVVNPERNDNARYNINTGIIDITPKINRYYIITERNLIKALDELVAWKREKGYEVITKAIEDIYEDSKYMVGQETGIVDEAESLRKYLQTEASGNAPFFCLLVGDHKTKMPVRKMKYTGNGITDVLGINSEAYIPTDDYFSDLTTTWNLYKDNHGLYVENLTEIQFSPDIYVGRLLCHSAEQIQNYISKLILYETNPGRGNASYLDNTSLFVQYDGRKKYENVLIEMEDTFESVECFLDTKISDFQTSGYPTGEMMLDKINQCGYVSLMGHGEPGTIACSGRLGNSDDWEYIKALDNYSVENGQTRIKDKPMEVTGLDKMTNVDSPSIIYTLACTTEPFDIYDDGLRFDLPHTMASSYTVGGNYGGVAYLGNTRSGYWTYSPDQEELFLQNIKTYKKIGVAEAMSKFLFDANNYRMSYVKHGHNLIGDPEIDMWMGKPSTLDVSLNFGEAGIGITGTDLYGCKVIQSDGMGNIKITNCNKAGMSYILGYMDDDDPMETIGIYKSGFLPIVALCSINKDLTNCKKSFVVRNASIGMDKDSVNRIDIGTDASVYIRAIDNAECGSSLIISQGGFLSINSDKTAIVEGSSVSNGGTFELQAEKAIISGGFVVKKGGQFSINKN